MSHGFKYEYMKAKSLIIKRLSKITDYTTSWALDLFNQIQLIKTEQWVI